VETLKAHRDMWGSKDAHSESKRAQGIRARLWERSNAAMDRYRAARKEAANG